MLNPELKYSRHDNIIWLEDTPLIRLKQNFPDIVLLNTETIEYLNRYFEAYPKLYETIQIENTMYKIVKMFYDLETTGTDVRKHGIHQISGIIEVNGLVAETFNFKVKPNPKAAIDPEALKVGGVTEEQIMAYPEMGVIYLKVLKLLDKYCGRYDGKDKIWLVGFNNRSFDDIFFRAWFEQNGDPYFGAWFWADSLDVLVLASQYLVGRRRSMPSFKLKRVALEVGLDVDESRLHDTALTRDVYRIVTGLEIEL